MVRSALVVACAALWGCGYSSGALRGGSDIQVRLDASRVAYVKTVTGTSTTKAIFCLMPVGDGSRYSNAMADLLNAARLKPNQILANLREDSETTFYFALCTTQLTISADIVDVAPMGAPPVPLPGDVAPPLRQ